MNELNQKGLSSLRLEDVELVTDLNYLSNEIYSKLDPSLRKELLKRGISVIQNSNVGFDSEFKNIGEKENKLISVQLAVNTKTYLKLPKRGLYKLSTIDPLTSQSYEIKVIPGFNSALFENNFNECIKKIRLLKYGKIDEAILKLQEGLQKMGVPSMVKSDMYVFSFPFTDIQPLIYYDGGGKGISFRFLVRESNKVSEPFLQKSYDLLIETLKDI